MTVQISTVAFEGVEVRTIDVQVQLANGLPVFTIVGLPDKAVAESRERVRAALTVLGLSLPARRITVNLAPADLVKAGSHFDLPIALGILCAMEILPIEDLMQFHALGELGLDGALRPVSGVLPAALHAMGQDHGLICPAIQGAEAAWIKGLSIVAPDNLLQLMNHFRNGAVIAEPQPGMMPSPDKEGSDLRDIKGQEAAKRVLEIAAAGGHHLLLNGPPGSGKSMLAHRLPSILPRLEPEEILDVSMIHSLAGLLRDGVLHHRRPFRDPHHSASAVALAGGGPRAKPGEISLAHRGVLFLDELPEFSRSVLEVLRQPLETGHITIARAGAHVTYPARVQLIAAMNPCRCGEVDACTGVCARGPQCARNYQARISAPLYDRIDLYLDVPPVAPSDLSLPPAAEGSAEVMARVQAARNRQRARFVGLNSPLTCNAEAEGQLLEALVPLDEAGRRLLQQAAEKFRLSARSYHRVLKVARTIADLDQSDAVSVAHLSEALGYRRQQILS